VQLAAAQVRPCRDTAGVGHGENRAAGKCVRTTGVIALRAVAHRDGRRSDRIGTLLTSETRQLAPGLASVSERLPLPVGDDRGGWSRSSQWQESDIKRPPSARWRILQPATHARTPTHTRTPIISLLQHPTSPPTPLSKCAPPSLPSWPSASPRPPSPRLPVGPLPFYLCLIPTNTKCSPQGCPRPRRYRSRHSHARTSRARYSRAPR